MTKYTDLMLDIETLGTGPGCVILAVAAVPFYKSEGLAGAEFFKTIDIQSCQDLGLKIDPSTLHWWMQKPDLILDLQKDTFPLRGVLAQLSVFFQAKCTEDVRVWGKGPSFDNAILRDAYDRVGIKLPWRYSRERCVRTFLDGYEELLKDTLPFVGTPHHPVADALHQIRSMEKVQYLYVSDDHHELD